MEQGLDMVRSQNLYFYHDYLAKLIIPYRNTTDKLRKSTCRQADMGQQLDTISLLIK